MKITVSFEQTINGRVTKREATAEFVPSYRIAPSVTDDSDSVMDAKQAAEMARALIDEICLTPISSLPTEETK